MHGKKRKDGHLSLFSLLYLPRNEGILLEIYRTLINTYQDDFQRNELCGVRNNKFKIESEKYIVLIPFVEQCFLVIIDQVTIHDLRNL